MLNSSFTGCPLEIDIAFLMDGSESVDDPDFIKMKTFVITIIQSFFQMQFPGMILCLRIPEG